MLILQVQPRFSCPSQRSLQGFTILTQGTQIPESTGWAGKPPTVCSGLMNKNALAFAEVILALSEPPLRTHQCLGGV